MVIVGIDPGSTRIGYGVLETRGGKLLYQQGGLLRIPKGAKHERLLALERELTKLLLKARPDRAGVEKLFFTKNQKTALDVAEARGVILTAIAKQSIPVFEFTPSEVKRAVTGDGHASKEGVARVVRLVLDLPYKKTADDVTDALAIAIAASGVPRGLT